MSLCISVPLVTLLKVCTDAVEFPSPSHNLLFCPISSHLFSLSCLLIPFNPSHLPSSLPLTHTTSSTDTDFTGISQILTFFPGRDLVMEVNITIIDDNITEGTEEFCTNLASEDQHGVNITEKKAWIVMLDNGVCVCVCVCVCECMCACV